MTKLSKDTQQQQQQQYGKIENSEKRTPIELSATIAVMSYVMLNNKEKSDNHLEIPMFKASS